MSQQITFRRMPCPDHEQWNFIVSGETYKQVYERVALVDEELQSIALEREREDEQREMEDMADHDDRHPGNVTNPWAESIKRKMEEMKQQDRLKRWRSPGRSPKRSKAEAPSSPKASSSSTGSGIPPVSDEEALDAYIASLLD